jgi:FMN phosphatase YigB (HAD superfamily)
MSKPDPQIFHRALERLNANPAQAVFVGDHPDVDVAGRELLACGQFGFEIQVCHESSKPMPSSKNSAAFSRC